MKYRICNGTLITPEGFKTQDLLISDGKITSIIERNVISSDDYEEIQAANCYVSAGFVDIHQHGGGGSDYMDCEADTFVHATEAHLKHGITSVMPTFLSASKAGIEHAIETYKQAVNDPRIRTNLLGIHLEGPYISSAQAGAQKPEHVRRFDPAEYESFAAQADGYLKRWSVAPEVQGADDFAKFAEKNGITLSIAHSNADFGTVMRAYEMGFRHVTHLYSCTSSIVRHNGFRTAGVLEAAYYLEDMNVEIIADGCHLPQSLLNYVYKFKKKNAIALITDAMRAAGQETEFSFLGSREDPLPVLIEDGVAKLTDRSAFGGSIATGDRLIRTMVQSGVPLQDAVMMLTINPLRMMDLSVSKGLIAEGYDADICVFDQDIQITEVLCNGKPIMAQ